MATATRPEQVIQDNQNQSGPIICRLFFFCRCWFAFSVNTSFSLCSCTIPIKKKKNIVCNATALSSLQHRSITEDNPDTKKTAQMLYQKKILCCLSQSSQSDTLQLLLLAQINVYFIGCCFDIVKETHHALQMCISRNGQNSPLGSDLKTAGMLCTVCFLSKYVFLLFDCATYLNL